MPRFILALDQGTTSSRALLFDGDGAVRALAQREFTQHFPRPGWVEHDAEEIWDTQLAVAREAFALAGAAASDVAAIGITNQRETTVLWDRETGRPLHRALVWQDRRTAPLCEALRRAGQEPRVRRRTGLVLDPYFSGTKLRWLLDHLPRARRLAAAGRLAFGTIDTWLIWRLTRGAAHVTDPSNASRTLLLDLHRLRWDASLARLLDVPLSVLPDVVDSSGPCAQAHPDWLGGAIPIAGVAGDQQAALFGQGCRRVGQAKNTYGTGCFLLLNTGARPVPSRHGLLTTAAWRIAGRATYALEGSVFIAGAAVQWLRDGLGLIRDAREIEALAASVPDAGGVQFVPALAGLGAPYWDAEARGVITGLTRGRTAAHLARATLEAIAQQTADLLEAMRKDSGRALATLRVDGGATANDLLMQTQADLLGAPVERPLQRESTALGAAMLAGLGIGFWPSPAALDALRQVDRVFRPALRPAARQRQRAAWAAAVARARA
jgi:glycerol kinase